MTPNDTAGVVVPPPVFFVFFLVSAFVVERAYPTTLVDSAWSTTIGYVIVGASFLWLWLTEREFTRHQTNSSCSRSASALITTGPFRISRNPAYLGFGLMIAGFSIALNSIWILVAIMPAFASIYWLVVRKEEAYLDRLFGNEYEAYKRNVRRWL